jgi:hypothetical protein
MRFSFNTNRVVGNFARIIFVFVFDFARICTIMGEGEG